MEVVIIVTWFRGCLLKKNENELLEGVGKGKGGECLNGVLFMVCREEN